MKRISILFLLLSAYTSLAAHRFFPERYEQVYPEQDFFSTLDHRSLIEDDSQLSFDNDDSNLPDLVSVRLKGDTDLGYYYVTLFFGTPVQKQTLIVDTGSVTTTIPCSECGSNCGTHHFDGPFEHNNSATFQNFQCGDSFGTYVCDDCTSLPCSFSVAYVEGSSYSGHFTKDYVSFGNEIDDFYSHLIDKTHTTTNITLPKDSGNITNTTESTNSTDTDDEIIHQEIQKIIDQRRLMMPFGCTDRETKLFFEQEADGILGLGIQTNTRSSPPNLLDALPIAKSKLSRRFSLCYAQSGGYFTIGGHNTKYHESGRQIQYVSYNTKIGQYGVEVNRIEMDGKNIDVSKKDLNAGEGAFFDSGTTLTHLPRVTYEAVKQHVTDFCGANELNCGKNNRTSTTKLCWNYSNTDFPTVEEFINSFPTFKWYFGFNGEAEYEWRPQDYMYQKAESPTYCMGISRYDRETILGGTFMKNHDILFDKDNSRVGFVRANCASLNDPFDFNSLKPDGSNKTDEPTPQPVGQTDTTTEPEQKTGTNPEDNKNITNVGPVETFHHVDNDNGPNAIMYMLIAVALGVAIFGTLKVYKFAKNRKYSNMVNDIELPKVKEQEQDTSNMNNLGDNPDNMTSRTESYIQSVVEI